MGERGIIRRAQLGDQRAFQHLVETYHALVWRIVRVLVGDSCVAADVEQEAWLDVWLGLPGFQLDQPFRPWLLTVVKNRSRKQFRRHTLLTESFDDALTASERAPVDGLAQLVRWEAQRDLILAVTALPAEQARVLALRYFADLDLAEIALVTEAPLGTVKSRLHRALGALRERLSLNAQDGELNNVPVQHRSTE